MKPTSWYMEQYGEDWAEIVYEQDLQEYKQDMYLRKLEERVKQSAKDDRIYWISDGVNQ